VGEYFEAGVVVADVTVREVEFRFLVEEFGEVADDEGFSASAAAEEGEVLGDACLFVAENGIDDGFGFFAHEGFWGDVGEVED